jgi:hypothetical protein
MDKKLKIGLLIVAGIILIFTVLNFVGLLYPLNSFVSGAPDKRCNEDTDCMAKKTTCYHCDCGDAVNKDWDAFCPFRDTRMYQCIECLGREGMDYDIRCVESSCTKVWKIHV